MRQVALLAAAVLIHGTAQALEVRVHPAKVVYLWENKGEGTPKDLYSAVLQNVAFVNPTPDEVTIESAKIEATRAGAPLQQVWIDAATLDKSAARIQAYDQQGALKLLDFQFQTSRYLEGVKLSATRTLGANQAIIVIHRAMLFQGLPDKLTVTAQGRDKAGTAVEASTTLDVVLYQSPNHYRFPVRGKWMAAAAPSLHSHHRWGLIQEFAFDLVQFGADGLTHGGDGSKRTDYYDYGQPVYAACGGKVVAAAGDQEENDARMQQPGESAEAYAARSAEDQMKLLSEGFGRVMGNHVIIEHPNSEFSYYAHLQQGSVKVKVGDVVEPGQQIGNLGQSGNSTEPHLHFHVTDGPDIGYSRSLPVTFEGIMLYPSDDAETKHLQSGQLVIANP